MKELREFLSYTFLLECISLYLDNHPSPSTSLRFLFLSWSWYLFQRSIFSPKQSPYFWFWSWQDESWLFQQWYLWGDRTIYYIKSRCEDSLQYQLPFSWEPLRYFFQLLNQEGALRNQPILQHWIFYQQ